MVKRVQVSDGTVLNFPDEMSFEEIKSETEKFVANQDITGEGATAPTLGGELFRGISAGMENIGALATEAIPGLVKDLAGYEEAAEKDFQQYQEKLSKIQETYGRGTAWQDVATEEDFLDQVQKFGLFSSRLLGEGLPSLGVSIAGGLPGALIRSAGVAGAGAFGSSYLLNTPETYTNLLEKGDVENEAEYALGVGALKSGLDFLPVSRLLTKTFGKGANDIVAAKVLEKAGQKTAAQKIRNQAAETFALEGVTEAGQEAIDVAAENYLSKAPGEFFTPENIQRIAIAGYGGALSGGLAGAGGGAIQAFQEGSTDARTKKARSKWNETELLKEELSEIPATIKVGEKDLETVDPSLIVKSTDEARTILQEIGIDTKEIPQSKLPEAATLELNRVQRASLRPVKNVARQLKANKTLLKAQGVESNIPLSSPILESIHTKQDFDAVAKNWETPVDRQKKVNKYQTSYKTDPQEVSKEGSDWLRTNSSSVNTPRVRNKIERVGLDPQKFVEGKKEGDFFQFNSLQEILPPQKNKEIYHQTNVPNARKLLSTLNKKRGRLERLFVSPDQNLALGQKGSNITLVLNPKKTMGWFAPSLANETVPGYEYTVDVFADKPVEAIISKNQKYFDNLFKNLPKTREKFDFDNIQKVEGGYRLNKKQVVPEKTPKKYPREQKYGYRDVLETPVYNKDDDPYTFISNNIRGIDIVPFTSDDQTKKLVKDLDDAVKRVGGKDANLQVFQSLQNFKDTKRSEPLRGFQLGNLINVALDLQNNFSDTLETSMHETWHYLYDEGKGLFTQNERKIIQDALPKIKEVITERYGMSPIDMKGLLNEPTGTMEQELVAHAFGMYAKDRRDVIQRGVPTGVRGVFEKAIRLLRDIKNALTKNDIGRVEAIFERTLEGTKAPKQAINNAVQEAHVTRLQNVSNAIKDRLREEELLDTTRGDMWSSLMDDSVMSLQEPMDRRYTAKDFLIKGTKYFETPQHRATWDSAFAVPYVIVREQENFVSRGMTEAANVADQYSNKPDAVRIKAAEVMDHLRNTDQSIQVDEEGAMVFERDGKLVRLTHPDMVKTIQALDQLLKTPLGIIRNTMQSFVNALVPNAQNKTPEQILQELDQQIEQEKNRPEGQNEAIIKDLEDSKGYVQDVQQIDLMMEKPYFPHMRFGPYGTVVHRKSNIDPKTGKINKDAEAAYFATIEEGKHLGKYDKFQYEALQKDLQYYKDRPDEFVIYRPKGKQGDLFTVQSEEFFNNLPNSLQTFETMVSALNMSRSEADYERHVKALEAKLASKGVNKHFLESKNTPGYSKDYLRVVDNYVSNTINYAGRQKYGRLLDQYNVRLDKFKRQTSGRNVANEHIEEIQNYIEYQRNPQQEFQNFVKFNFVWTMGLNISSAALQFVGLPVFTNGALTQINPNVFQNMGTIWRNLNKFIKVFQNKAVFEVRNGALRLRFDQKEFLDQLDFDKDTKEFIVDFLKTVHSGEQLVEQEALGTNRSETRSIEGKTYTFSDAVVNFTGVFMNGAEQITRLVTAVSAYETMKKDNNLERTLDLYNNDQSFKVKRRISNNPAIYDAVYHFVDTTHAVFGKSGRAPFQTGYGRIAFPFTGYPQQINELMLRMARTSPQSRGGLIATTGGILFFAGVLGLPGAELLKELVEAAYSAAGNENIDLERELRAMMFDLSGKPEYGEALTQGIPRTFSDFDFGGRLRQQIAGQDIILALMGVRGGMEELFGVQGSVVSNAIAAGQGLRQGDSIAQVTGLLTPTAMSNFFKAWNYTESGVSTRRGTQLLTPEEVGADMVFLRILGFSHSDLASAREEQYWATLMNSKYDGPMNTFRNKGKRIMTSLARAIKNGENEKAQQYRREYKELSEDVVQYLVKNELAYNMRSFHRSVKDAMEQRLIGGPLLKDYDKMVRNEYTRNKLIAGTVEE